jgi:hypothetical protein
MKSRKIEADSPSPLSSSSGFYGGISLWLIGCGITFHTSSIMEVGSVGIGDKGLGHSRGMHLRPIAQCLAPILTSQIYETILYVLTPFSLPMSLIVRPEFCVALMMSTLGLYLLHIVIFNAVHLRQKNERICWKVVLGYYVSCPFAAPCFLYLLARDAIQTAHDLDQRRQNRDISFSETWQCGLSSLHCKRLAG